MNTTESSLKRSRRLSNRPYSMTSLVERGTSVPCLLALRQLFAEPAHGPIKMMQLQFIYAVDAIIIAPMLAGPVGAGHHQPMQHGQEYRALDGELEAAPGEQALEYATTTAPLP